MRTNRERKKLIIFMLMFSIASLSIGFAAFSTVLNISSSASVNPNNDSFKVKFSTSSTSLQEGAVSPKYNPQNLAATSGTIDNTTNPTLSNLSVTFTKPGQSVSYRVYAINVGEYNAYLNNVIFSGEKTCTPGEGASPSLVQSACESIKIEVSVASSLYTEDMPPSYIFGNPLKKGASEEFTISLKYESNGTYVDGPFSIKFPDITLIYSTVADTDMSHVLNNAENMSGTLNSKIKADALYKGTDTNVDFAQTPETGVYVRSGTENHVNPIYYYRGAVTNNNVLFANKCWLVVRTTETGGVKLIYNGTPTSDNKCNGDNSTLGNSAFNYNYNSIEDVSYIYSDGTNSTIKQTIDTWYTSNMTSYTDMLEDTVWCNDRSVTFSGYHDDYGTDVTFFGVFARNVEKYQPSLHCPAEYSLTTSTRQTSNKLTYPVALLTADELTLAGMGGNDYISEVYLNNNDLWWTMSPSGFVTGKVGAFVGRFNGGLYNTAAGSEVGVRPAISLKAGTIVARGNGTPSTPYIIE